MLQAMTRSRSRAKADADGGAKRPFEIDVVMERLRQAIRPFPKAAMFELAEQGYATLFQQTVACMISIRTRDEVSGPAARRLFARAPGPAEVAALSPDEIAALIQPATFNDTKARQIQAIARRVVDELGGEVPCDSALLQSFPGIGPKCANLALGVACGQPHVAVDVHVHRVTNRWGYVHTRNEAETTAALETQLPQQYWIEINSLLVPFGKHICSGQLPRCSTCPLLAMCQQIGVTTHR
jgi:endonuclease-3